MEKIFQRWRLADVDLIATQKSRKVPFLYSWSRGYRGNGSEQPDTGYRLEQVGEPILLSTIQSDRGSPEEVHQTRGGEDDST